MIAKKVNKKRVNAFDKKNIFCYHGNGSSSNEILILDMFNPYLSNARPVIAVAYMDSCLSRQCFGSYQNRSTPGYVLMGRERYQGFDVLNVP